MLSLGCAGLPAQTPPAANPAEPSQPASQPAGDDAQTEALRQALHAASSGAKPTVAQPIDYSKLFAQATGPEAPPAPAQRARPVTIDAASATTNTVPGLPTLPPPGAARPATAAPPIPTAPGATTPGAATPGPATPGAANAVLGGQNDTFIAVPPPSGGTNAQDDIIGAGMINFPNTELTAVLPVYAELVNRTILRPTSLPTPNITLKTQTPLTKKEAIQAFDAVFALNGITMVNVGDKFVKMVPEQQVFSTGAAFDNLKTNELPELGQFITHVAQLKYVKPTDMVAVLQPFMKIPNAILPIDASQILVLRDYTENVKRMLEMIARVDIAVPSEFDSEVIMIKYAKASDIANVLNTLSSGGGGGTTIGSGGSSRGGARTTGSGAGFNRGTGTGFGGAGTGFGGAGTGYPGSTGFGSTPFGTQNPQGAATPVAANNANTSFTSRLQNIINRASGAGEFQILGQTKMIADERTNSLLIYATKEDMKTIKEIIAKLDVVLAQVLIEAVIIEVDLNKTLDYGVSYLEQQFHPGAPSYFQGRGAINPGSILSASSFGTATNLAGALPGGFSYLATLGNDLDVTVSAVQGNSVGKVLQRPRIQTSHNEPASLFVGESRPYPSGSYYGGGSFGGYSSIQAVNIGVTLEVTPLINPDGLVVMEIHQTIESVSGSVNIANVGDVPVTSRKDASTKVSVRDHETIMVGGLIETTKTKSNSGVPLLKDIPGIGLLFRSNSDKEDRSELVVLIRPTVLRTPEVAAQAARDETAKMPGVSKAKKEMEEEDRKIHDAHERDANKH
jgi:general secretion pathway protein D